MTTITPSRHWASSYIGQPWSADGQDCYAFVRSVYLARYGVTIPLVALDAGRALSCAHAIHDYDLSDWLEVDAPREGDVVLMGHARRPHHVGLWIDAGGLRVLHSVEGSGVIAQTPAQVRLQGWNLLRSYRHKDVLDVMERGA